MASASPFESSSATAPLWRCANASARSRASASISSTPSAPRPPASGSRSQEADSSASSTLVLTAPNLATRDHVARVATATPLQPAPAALGAGASVWLKREDQHELGAFKWRGALPALERFQADGSDAVVTASTGNHGAASAWAAQRIGLRAIVFVPKDASRAKVDRLAALGAELHEVGPDLDASKELAREFAAERGLAFFEDGAEPAQFDGYAAIGREIVDQLGEQPERVVVPVGNGALLIGVARGLNRSGPGRARPLAHSDGGAAVAVVAKEAPVMALS